MEMLRDEHDFSITMYIEPNAEEILRGSILPTVRDRLLDWLLNKPHSYFN